MSELKLTQDRMKTYNGEDNKGAFKTSARLETFGERQNAANELLAANVNELIKRVCLLEDQQVRNNEIMKKLASELTAFKAEIDRLKLTAKLNTNAVQRLNNAINLASGSSSEEQ
ncbi:MAG: hypothetical protein IJX77_05120 [Ruminococcus sp.]|nr:hypothetical protein [Ruminococcus sp.]